MLSSGSRSVHRAWNAAGLVLVCLGGACADGAPLHPDIAPQPRVQAAQSAGAVGGFGTPLQIDGILDSGWNRTAPHSILVDLPGAGRIGEAKLYLMNDGNELFFAARLSDNLAQSGERIRSGAGERHG